MGAFTGLTTTSENIATGGGGVKTVSGTLTGPASYDSSGSVADVSSLFSDECRGMVITDITGEFKAFYVNAAANAPATGKILIRGMSWDLVTVDHQDLHPGLEFTSKAPRLRIPRLLRDVLVVVALEDEAFRAKESFGQMA